ncbi:RloB family protein [Paenarthrobacter sp. NyZ202]|uniref:RloB family protein n=1 Tax=Paenarthrobacter sp. NyZ202 TaxID=3402689 RepID=UPI003CF7677A
MSEGKVTEPEYFTDVKDRLRDDLIQVRTVGGVGDPLQVVEHAVRLKRDALKVAKQQRDDNLSFDHVWCVFDVDDFTRIPTALSLAKREKINVAVSNPCFEVWPLLHFTYTTAYLSSEEAAERLRVYMPDYDKSLDCSLLRGNFQKARAAAKKLDTEHEKNGSPSRHNPSTQVWSLIDAIIASAISSGVNDGDIKL